MIGKSFPVTCLLPGIQYNHEQQHLSFFHFCFHSSMPVALITGSGGLIGSAAVQYFATRFEQIIGIDNDLRAYFFGSEASTTWKSREMVERYPTFKHEAIDIRDLAALTTLFATYGSSIDLIIHAAAQPSHDWAAKEPFTDFAVNATGTLQLLELTRQYCPNAVFIFTSTNKVYGEGPNALPFYETDTRWEVAVSHPYSKEGIDERMSIDQSKHSLFGVSKVAADLMVQEYGRYFGLRTGVFRGGCLTGPNHSGAQLHGFLAYLMKCTLYKEPYSIFGYKGKQVRDNIHSHDLVRMFDCFYQSPRPGEVYNAGGGRFANCSLLEAIALCETITGNRLNVTYSEAQRSGDHKWYVSDVSKFRQHYPEWNWSYSIQAILEDIFRGLKTRA